MGCLQPLPSHFPPLPCLSLPFIPLTISTSFVHDQFMLCVVLLVYVKNFKCLPLQSVINFIGKIWICKYLLYHILNTSKLINEITNLLLFFSFSRHWSDVVHSLAGCGVLHSLDLVLTVLGTIHLDLLVSCKAELLDPLPRASSL